MNDRSKPTERVSIMRVSWLKLVTNAVLFSLLCVMQGTSQPPPLQPPDPSGLPTVVQIGSFWLSTTHPSAYRLDRLGSGTIIHPRGLILTSSHTIRASAIGSGCGTPVIGDLGQLFIVLVAEKTSEPPVPKFVAQYIIDDQIQDLAVIRIGKLFQAEGVRDLNQLIAALRVGNFSTAPLPSDLRLPFIKIGDSDRVAVGDNVKVIGYPLHTYPGPIPKELLMLQTISSGTIIARDPEYGFFIRAFATFGFAGSPVIGKQDQLVGVACGGTFTPEGFLTVARPSNLAIPLIQEAVLSLGFQEPPTVNFAYSPFIVRAGNIVKFDASSSYDADLDALVRYEWDFGDGVATTSPRPTAVHVYERPGTYTVKVTVTDERGATNSTSKSLEVMELESPKTQFEQIVEHVSPTVAFIQAGSITGSGFVVSPDGYLITAAHVVCTEVDIAEHEKREPRITVRIQGQEYNAIVQKMDVNIDVALLKVDAGAEKLPSVKLGDSAQVRPQDEVLAIGYPAILPPDKPIADKDKVIDPKRTLGVGRCNTFASLDLILTKIFARKGMSGGPLLNIDGEVIGMIHAGQMLSAELNVFLFSVPSNAFRQLTLGASSAHSTQTK